MTRPDPAQTAAQAIEAARRARQEAEAVFPLAIQTMSDLRHRTLDLADLMETYAVQLREAAKVARRRDL